ncbi:hypothetical protein [Nakamurella sp.]|uniref:hypothetical protein n=1 Tax=Nakamurella sp. TaxID=1869182 RepID=UPI0037849CEF
MPTPTTVYTSRATNWPFLAIASGLAVPLIVMGLTAVEPERSLTGTLVVAGVIVVGIAMSTSLRVTAGTGGVTVRSGLLGLPRWTFPIDRIAHAEPAELAPWAMFGGIWWSSRDGLRITQRTGPALRLRLTDGRRVTLTVNEPDVAVTVLSDAIRARGEQHRS